MGSNSIVVALTGSIGTGKSEAAKLFQDLGAKIIDADVIARELTIPNSKAFTEIINEFGNAFLLADGSLDRKKLGNLIFTDSKSRQKLESILHPKIRIEFLRQLDLAKATSEIIVYVVPLLFESGYCYQEIEKIIVVAAQPETSLARIVTRDKTTMELAEKKLASQININEKISQADFVIDNSSDLKHLQKQVELVFGQLQALSKTKK